jgi:hypothetical protein
LIAEETNLSLRTVRTIVDKVDGVDRATPARLRIAPDKFEEARERSSERMRSTLARHINEIRKPAPICSSRPRA